MKVANVRLLFIRNNAREQNDWSLVVRKFIQQRSHILHCALLDGVVVSKLGSYA